MRRLSKLLVATPALQVLSERAGEIQALQKIWEAVTPSPINCHSHVGSLREGQLVVNTSSNAVAAKLKMQLNGLVNKLQTQRVKVTSIRVKVQVESMPLAPSGLRRKPSKKAAETLRIFAETLPDSRLRKGLERLAKRSRP